MKYTFSVAGLNKKFEVLSSFDLEKNSLEKKKVRWSIASKMSVRFIPFHAVLVEKKGSGYLISGPSGSGKSTISKYFIDKGYKVVANDFVVVWSKNGNNYAGDLNIESANYGKSRVKVHGFIFLNCKDKRDLYRMNTLEVREIYREMMRPWSQSQSDKFSKSTFFKKLTLDNIAIGNRQSVTRSIEILKHALSRRKVKTITIVGLGVLGQDIANILVGLDHSFSLNLYSRSFDKVASIVYDLQSANPERDINSVKDLEDCLENTDILIFSFKSDELDLNINVQERYKRFLTHAKIVWEYSRLIRKSRFKGNILFLTNPVDLLGKLMYIYSNMSSRGVYDWKGLYTSQIFSIGIGLDYSRMKVLTKENLEIVGEHGDNQFLCKVHKDNLYAYKNSELMSKVKNYSEEVRKFNSRTRFGPSHETVNVIETILDKNGMIRVSTISGSGLICGRPQLYTGGLLTDLYNIDKKIIKKLPNYNQEIRMSLNSN